MDERVVQVRTSQSAQDFWARIRGSSQYDTTNFKIRTPNENDGAPPPKLALFPTPFNVQQRPFMCSRSPVVNAPPPPPPSPIRNPLIDSRAVERRVLALEIDSNDGLRHDNVALQGEVERTRKQLMVALRINHGLTGQMVANARR